MTQFEAICNYQRAVIGGVVKEVRELSQADDGWQHRREAGEIEANLTLAFRHLEDARMRIGKALQARDGGVSYDQEAKAN